MRDHELRGAAGVICHVVNRSARRLRLFDEPSDYAAFLSVVEEGRARTGIEILAYCVMPNHFHLLTRTTKPRQLSFFMQWFQLTHAKRWNRHRGSCGIGAVYQGRFRSVPVQHDVHFLVAARYVERNALRARLVERAEDWPWCSLSQRCRSSNAVTLADWPILPPANWVALVNDGRAEEDSEAVRDSLRKRTPFGTTTWADRHSKRAARGKGRPPKGTALPDLRIS
jgi:putative transposase